MHVEIIKTHPQFIHMKLGRKGETPWLLSVVYGSPHSSLRKFLWKDLRKGNLDLTYPRLIIGDFNSFTAAEEVSNPGKLDKRRCTGFLEWIHEHELIDMGFTGPRFTWSRGVDTKTFKGARLDRALCNMA